VATQAHPELKSRPDQPHPLFASFVGAAVVRRGPVAATASADGRETAETVREARPAAALAGD
jgi:hypothetical protein